MARFDEGFSLRTILKEADEDPNATDTASEETSNEEDPNANVGGNEEDAGDSTDGSPDDAGSEEDTGEDDEDNADKDFNIDAEDNIEDDAGEDTDTNDDNDTGEEPNSDSGDNEEVDPDSLKALDGKLYEDLSPAEQKLKLRHMKHLYTDLFYKCASISEKLNSVFVEDDEATLQIKMAGSMVFNLKQMISDYFLNIFDSKSYQENDAMFNRYLAMLDQVKRLTDELKNMYFSDSE